MDGKPASSLPMAVAEADVYGRLLQYRRYAARIYANEPTLLYGTHFGSFFGRGMRLVLTTRADVGSHLVALCKVGSTNISTATVFRQDCSR